ISQGERKLLDVAIAYSLRPRLLFLDEPTSGVSTREKAPIMDTITSVVRSEGISAAIIEHDMDVVFNYSDRIVAMHQGAILGIGYAPEDAGVFPDLTVDENFQVAEWITGSTHPASGPSDRERIFAVFPEVRQFLSRRGLHLSGGQKKMVAITRAMTLNPSIL